MDYNKMQTFVTVADLGSITGAAQQLNRSQSAISQQILSLEAELELKLLERKAGKVLLSKDGERLYQIAKTRLRQIADEVGDLKKNLRAIEGHIRVGMVGDSANNFEIGALLAAFRLQYPKITVSVSYGTSAEIERDLLANTVDVGLLIFFKQPELFIRKPVNSCKQNIYTSATYLKHHGPIRNYKELLDAHLIEIGEGFTCFAPWYRKNAPSLLTSLKHRKPDIIVPNHRALSEVIFAGYGVAILPDYIAEEAQAKKRCERLFLSSRFTTSGLDMAYRTGKTLRLCEDLFLKKTQEFLKST